MIREITKWMVGAVVLGGSLFSGPPAAMPVLSLAPALQDVRRSESFSVDVKISDVADLYAFQFDLMFDPAVLAATAVREGPFLPGAGPTLFLEGTLDNASGIVSFTLDTLLGAVSGRTGSGVLAIFDLQVSDIAAIGPSALALGNVVLLDSTIQDITPLVEAAQVSVVIPEPPLSLLLFIALLVLTVCERMSLSRRARLVTRGEHQVELASTTLVRWTASQAMPSLHRYRKNPPPPRQNA